MANPLDTPAIQSLCSSFGVPSLPPHLLLALSSCAFFFFVQSFSHFISPILFPAQFSLLSKRTSIDWDLHSVRPLSLFQSHSRTKFSRSSPTDGMDSRSNRNPHLSLPHQLPLSSNYKRSHLWLFSFGRVPLGRLCRLLFVRLDHLSRFGEDTRNPFRASCLRLLLYLFQSLSLSLYLSILSVCTNSHPRVIGC